MDSVTRPKAYAQEYARIWSKDQGWSITAYVRFADGTFASVEGIGSTMREALSSFWTHYYSLASREQGLVIPS